MGEEKKGKKNSSVRLDPERPLNEKKNLLKVYLLRESYPPPARREDSSSAEEGGGKGERRKRKKGGSAVSSGGAGKSSFEGGGELGPRARGGKKGGEGETDPILRKNARPCGRAAPLSAFSREKKRGRGGGNDVCRKRSESFSSVPRERGESPIA